MKRFLKWFFGIVLVLVLLVVGLIFALPYIVNPNDYKDEIIAQAKPYMKGRSLKIPGDIKISIVPWLGFELGEVVIGNAGGFVVKPFATIQQSRAHVRFWPLLFKEIEIDTIDINGLVINLQSDAEGRNNWSDLAAAQKTSPFIRTSAQPARASEPLVLPKMKVQGLHFGDARINFEDGKNKTDITISKMSIDAGPIDQLNPIPIKAQFNYHSKSQGVAAASAMATVVTITPASSYIQLDQFVINTNVSGEAVSNKTVPTSLKIPALKIDLAREKIEARPFHLKLDQYQSEGRFNLTKFAKPIIRFGLEMKDLDLDKVVPPAPDVPAVAPVPVAAESTQSETMFAPLVALKNADIQGTIKIAKLHARKLQMQDFKVNVLARSGLVSALPEAKLYGGTYEGDAQITVRKFPISVRTKHKLVDVSIGPVVEALTGKATLTGNAKIQAQYITEGNTTDEMMRNLNGDTQFNIRNAELKLLDAEKMVLGKWFEKLKLEKKQDEKKEVTVFDSIRGTIRVKSGVAYNKDLIATSKRVNITGTGHAILFKQEINYTLYTIFKKSLAISMGSSSYDLKNKKIPTHITGTFSNPEIDNDLEEVLKGDFAGSKLDRKKTALEEKVKGKLGTEKEKLEDKLDRFLKR